MGTEEEIDSRKGIARYQSKVENVEFIFIFFNNFNP